jgi:hypothetical protein
MITPGTPLKIDLEAGLVNATLEKVQYLHAGSSPSDFELIPQSQQRLSTGSLENGPHHKKAPKLIGLLPRPGEPFNTRFTRLGGWSQL